jgi:hypothetical protein
MMDKVQKYDSSKKLACLKCFIQNNSFVFLKMTGLSLTFQTTVVEAAKTLCTVSCLKTLSCAV